MPPLIMPGTHVFKPILVKLTVFFVAASMCLRAQDFNLNSAVYNTLLGSVSAGLGAVVNHHGKEKKLKVFLNACLAGAGGGLVMYSGKKLNFLISQKETLGYAWLTRAVYSAGNSVVENASAGRGIWSQWHYDIGFVRVEIMTAPFRVQPRLLPSALGGMLFTARHGQLDLLTTLKSGVFTYRTGLIGYAPTLIGSTTGNSILLSDTLLSGHNYYDVYAHEMVHVFQFQDLSGINYLFTPLTAKWEAASPGFKRLHRWVYGDLNYELMMLNYFLINGGSRGSNYCHNFLENEAEFLSTGRPACH